MGPWLNHYVARKVNFKYKFLKSKSIPDIVNLKKAKLLIKAIEKKPTPFFIKTVAQTLGFR